MKGAVREGSRKKGSESKLECNGSAAQGRDDKAGR